MGGGPRPAAIEACGLRFRWSAKGRTLLDIPALEIAQGERVFIYGPSGSGKSTLLSLFGGVLLPEHGEIAVLGRSLRGMSASGRDALRADHLGFIFQQFNLIPYLDVRGNVTLPCRFSRLRRARARARGGIEAEADRLLQHLGLGDAALGRRRPDELSVGQQQRVAAARALIGAPEILIADEPTSALDADRKEAFLALLLAECAAQDTTLVFVSHDTALAEVFDRAIALTDINRAPGDDSANSVAEAV